jgi:hypothetical protein
MNIFVGNLLFEATGADVKKLFEGYGFVASVVIAMEKEKKAPKSRGFGFVQMPDEQQALAAIAALNGKEFMGRVLNVNPARPKPVVEQDKGEAKKIRSEIKVKGQEYLRKEGEQKDAWYNPVFNKKRGRYKTGRRSLSFMKQRAASGIVQEATPKRESRENPMRWRKRKAQPKPWQRSSDEHKPWKKAEEGARPWKKAEGESKPWRKSEGGIKPWKKPEGESRPRKKPGGEIRTWRKSGEEPKPWKKPAGESKPWRKSSKRPRPRQSRIESRRKPGGYTR